MHEEKEYVSSCFEYSRVHTILRIPTLPLTVVIFHSSSLQYARRNPQIGPLFPYLLVGDQEDTELAIIFGMFSHRNLVEITLSSRANQEYLHFSLTYILMAMMVTYCYVLSC